jgi:predicted cobalt transporter CbtA
VFSLAPALGLPPALPGSPEAPLFARQAWWLATILATAGGLWLIVLAPVGGWRWLGVPLLALPHLFGVPAPPEALAPPLVDLTRRFIAVTLTVNLSSWLALGAVSGWVWSRQRY